MCDNRSASGKGIRPTWQAYKRLGEPELRDIEAGLAWLKQQPWVDAERIGIWGWSYGGFMAAYALTHSTSFKVGISGAPVTDWRLYDSVYTERYMGTPQNNPEGYDATSVIKAAGGLHGKLLLIHGTMDDNVHLQNTIQLVHALQEAGKQFQLMLYPATRHSLKDQALLFHWYTLMTEFVRDNL
jgi:dipeptidyl-peptidase-4